MIHLTEVAALLPPPEEHRVDVALIDAGIEANNCIEIIPVSSEEDNRLAIETTDFNMAPESVVQNLEKDHTSNDGASSSVLTPCSTFYLGSSSDNPGTPLVATALNGYNYRMWARSMKTALRAKMMLGYIDGSIKKPESKSKDYANWEKADSVVMAWIINATDPNLHGSISHASTARDIWLDLEERFAQTNAPRVHQLWCTLCLMEKEHDLSVTVYYTRFKSLFDELDELQPLPECSCGAAKQLTQREEAQRVHLFLGGLNNEQYSHVKTTILNSDPLPSLRLVFNNIQREESCFTAEKERGRDGPRPRCDHCGKIGHIKAKCFEIIGYPSNWDTRRTQHGANKQGAHSGAHLL